MLNKDTLAGAIADLIVSESANSETTRAEVSQTPKEDGTLETAVTFSSGPVVVDREKVMPLARAIAQAVVDHIKTHAEVQDLDPTNGGTWRIT